MWGLQVVVLAVRGILIGNGRCPLLGLVHWKLDHGYSIILSIDIIMER